VIHLGHVVWDDDAGHRTGGLGDADGPIHEVRRLGRDHKDVDVLARHVLVEAYEIDLLLEVAAEAHPLLLTDYRDDGLVVELRVVEAVQKVYGAGSARRHAHPDLAGEFRVGAGGEGGYLLVGRLGELDPVSDLVEGAEEPVDAIPGITVDALYAPLAEAIKHELCCVWHT
jgi:hypothetical protein